MNKELDLLAKEYVKNKDRNVLTKIFNILKYIIKKKAAYIYYVNIFHEGKIVGHQIMQPQNKKVPIHEFTFKLSETGQVDLEDIEQELALEIIRILNKWNPKYPFDTYLFGALWQWLPKFARKNKFLKVFKLNSMNIIDENGEEKSLIDGIPATEIKNEENLIDLFENLTENEKKIIILYQENLNITQTEIAMALGITQSGVCRLLQGLKKKYIG
jgi:RNA polymerase sigma factor (sigma-70 family)